MKHKIISQNMLSGECWLVQVWGDEACDNCEYRNTDECGGREIIRTGRNALGCEIPLPDVSQKPEAS